MSAKPTPGAAVFPAAAMKAPSAPAAFAMKAPSAPAAGILLPVLVLALLVLACGGPLQFRGGPSGPERRLAEDISRILDHPDLAPMTIGVKVVSPVRAGYSSHGTPTDCSIPRPIPSCSPPWASCGPWVPTTAT